MDRAKWRELWSRMPLADAVLSVWRFLCEPARLGRIFADNRGRCYDREIAFPDLVQLIADALLEYGGSGNQSFSRGRETGMLTASKVAAYGKLGRLPLAVSQEFLTTLTRSLGEILPSAARRLPPASLCGFRKVLLDVHRQLTAWSVLVEAGLPLVDIPLAPNAAALTDRLHDLLGGQWSDRWIKAVNKRRRPHQPRPHDRTHGSVFRILHPPVTPSTSEDGPRN